MMEYTYTIHGEIDQDKRASFIIRGEIANIKHEDEIGEFWKNLIENIAQAAFECDVVFRDRDSL